MDDLKIGDIVSVETIHLLFQQGHQTLSASPTVAARVFAVRGEWPASYVYCIQSMDKSYIWTAGKTELTKLTDHEAFLEVMKA